MQAFKALLTAYLSAHPNLLPPADSSEDFSFERSGLEWKVSVWNGGELFVAAVDCEDLLGWIWLQRAGQQKSNEELHG